MSRNSVQSSAGGAGCARYRTISLYEYLMIAIVLQNCTSQRQTLLGLYGIGPQSIGYVFFAVFHHRDEMDHISPQEQKIYSKLFFNPNPEKPVATDKLTRLFEKHFAGYSALAVHYIWEDLFWKRQHEKDDWLEPLIRL